MSKVLEEQFGVVYLGFMRSHLIPVLRLLGHNCTKAQLLWLTRYLCKDYIWVRILIFANATPYCRILPNGPLVSYGLGNTIFISQLRGSLWKGLPNFGWWLTRDDTQIWYLVLVPWFYLCHAHKIFPLDLQGEQPGVAACPSLFSFGVLCLAFIFLLM